MDICEIFVAIEVSENYVYSGESHFILGEKHYSMRKKAIYNEKGDLKKFILYKPEGILEHTKDEIESDMAIINNSYIPFKQNWVFDGEVIDKGNEKISVVKEGERILKTTVGRRVIFYKVR